MLCKSELWLWEEVWSELHGGLHVSFDFHLSLHEGILRIELSFEQIECILIDQSERSISLSLFSFLDSAWSILEVDGPYLWLLAFGFSNFEMVDKSDFFDNVSSLLLEEGFHFIEAGGGLKWHFTKKVNLIITMT